MLCVLLSSTNNTVHREWLSSRMTSIISRMSICADDKLGGMCVAIEYCATRISSVTNTMPCDRPGRMCVAVESPKHVLHGMHYNDKIGWACNPTIHAQPLNNLPAAIGSAEKRRWPRSRALHIQVHTMHGSHGVSSHNTCVQSHDTTCYVGDLLGTGHPSSHFTDEIQATSVARVSHMDLHDSCITHRVWTISNMHVYTSMGES